MPRLFHPDMELLVGWGYLYVPLLFDPDIAEEAAGGDVGRRPSRGIPGLVEDDGRVFIRTLSIQSLVESYDRIDPSGYERLKRVVLQGRDDARSAVDVSPDGKLGTIILKIMPHFVRMSRGLERGPVSPESFMDRLCARIDIPERFMEEAAGAVETGQLLRRLEELDGMQRGPESLPDGSVTGDVLARWIEQKVGQLIVEREKMRIEEEIRERRFWSESRTKHRAAMLYLAHLGQYELDGFGFSRIGSGDEYFVYKRTGEYILKDYYGRSYRFPDCRVAVSTGGPLQPIVMERYKHPFLLHHRPMQEICLSGYERPGEVTAENIIGVLEAGITALLYGYDARRRNGYHSLDKTLYYVKTIEFDDYRV